MSRAKKFSWIRLGKLFLLIGFAFYFSICAYMSIFQRSFIYHPPIFTSALVELMAQRANLERWKNSSGKFIGLERFSPTQPAHGTVLLAHGNGGTAIGSAHYADDIQKVATLDVFILEYPGYADRAGSPTEKNLFAAAREAFQALPTNQPIYLIGESLGSGVASYLAGTFPQKIAGVILISPFDSLASVAQNHYPILPVGLLLADHFASEKYLQNFHGKLGVTVDGKDFVVPEKFGLRLYKNYDGPKKIWEFPDGGHCQISEPQTNFWKDAIQFLQNKTFSHT